ncbi:MAG TPA: HupE/UreJ family protein, partial [Polyangium sp.]|nr:HupE/UreJ family protein [Polyangium sp.]
PWALVGLAIFEVCYLGLLAKSSVPERLRWMSASLFGLVHGFGFAGLLKQIDLPPGHRAAPLASFNIGLELAQIAVVCCAWPLLERLRKRYTEKNVIVWGSAVTLAIGTYACITRIWG